MMSVEHTNAKGSTVLVDAEPQTNVKRALTLLVVDTHSVEKHNVFVGHLSHHAGRFKEGLEMRKDHSS